MSIIVGEGAHRYEVIENWGKLPDGWRFGEVAAVAAMGTDMRMASGIDLTGDFAAMTVISTL